MHTVLTYSDGDASKLRIVGNFNQAKDSEWQYQRKLWHLRRDELVNAFNKLQRYYDEREMQGRSVCSRWR